METQPPERFFSSLVEIIGANNVTYGAGVAIGGNRVLTCAHVVTAAMGGWKGFGASDGSDAVVAGPKIRRPYLDGADSEAIQTELRRADFYPRRPGRRISDLAVLIFDAGACLRADESPPFGEHSPPAYSKLHVLGFPADRAAAGLSVDDAIYEIGLTGPTGWRSMTACRDFGSYVRGGFSGGPVWSVAEGQIAGIAVEANAENGTALLIPVEVIREIITLPPPAPPSVPAAVAKGAITPLAVTSPGLRLILERVAPGFHAMLTIKAKLLSDPPERGVISDYLGDLSAEFELNMRQKTFLPLPATSSPPSPTDARMFPQMIKALADRSSGGDGANAAVEALSPRSRNVRNIVSWLRGKKEPVILLGEPGAGKSMTLQQVAIGLAKQNERSVFPSLILFVPLGQWRPDKAGGPDVAALVRRFCPEPLLPYLDALRRSGRLVVIFDGMDEMSRDRYIEHTDALDRYANARDAFTKTLFSCRIADFSPSFGHRRLILQPFNRRLVKAYLAFHLDEREPLIDGERISLSRLSQRLMQDDLGIQATNPYVLYLLSLYIRETSSIPGKRTDLLSYYYRDALQRKRAERSDDLRLTCSDEVLFNEWSAVAFEITSRNRGSEIYRSEIGLVLGQRTEESVRLGQLIGLLRVRPARGQEPEVVHFENHRAQEFFCAWHIAKQQPEFDWRGRLNAPRWQETLVNAVQLESTANAVGELEASLQGGIDLMAGREPGALSPAAPIRSLNYAQLAEEADAAERVDLAARVARELPATSEREGLRARIREAIERFLLRGSPTAQSTMLRTLQRSPELGSLEMMGPVLNHKVGWIREQAYPIASRMSSELTLEGLITEINLAFADWSLPGKVLHYLTIAHKLPSRRIAVLTTFAVLGMLFQVLLFCGALPAIAALAANYQALPIGRVALPSASLWSTANAPAYLEWMVHARRYSPEILLSISIFGLIASQIFARQLVWIFTIGAQMALIGIFLIITILLQMLTSKEEVSIISIVAMMFFVAYVFYLGALFVSGIISLFGCVTLSIASVSRNPWRMFIFLVSRSFDQNMIFHYIIEIIKPIFYCLAGGLVLALLLFIGSKLFGNGISFLDVQEMPRLVKILVFQNTIYAGLIIFSLFALINVFGIVMYVITKNFDKLKETFSIGVGLLLAALAVLVSSNFSIKFFFFISKIVTIPNIPPVYLVKVTLTLLISMMFACLTLAAVVLFRRLHRIIVARLEEIWARKIDPKDWRAKLQTADPWMQAIMIANAAPRRFSLSLAETIDLLLEAQDYVTEDPAISRLHVRLAQLLGERRQERG